MKIDLSGSFLKAEDCEGGEIMEISDPGIVSEITSPEGKVKKVLNFECLTIKGSEKLETGKDITYTPNKNALGIFIEAWSDETDTWVGKRFKIILVKVPVFGKMKDSIIPEPLKETAKQNSDNEKPKIETVRM